MTRPSRSDTNLSGTVRLATLSELGASGFECGGHPTLALRLCTGFADRHEGDPRRKLGSARCEHRGDVRVPCRHGGRDRTAARAVHIRGGGDLWVRTPVSGGNVGVTLRKPRGAAAGETAARPQLAR